MMTLHFPSPGAPDVGGAGYLGACDQSNNAVTKDNYETPGVRGGTLVTPRHTHGGLHNSDLSDIPVCSQIVSKYVVRAESPQNSLKFSRRHIYFKLKVCMYFVFLPFIYTNDFLRMHL